MTVAGATQASPIPRSDLARVVEIALAEDVGTGDVTSEALLDVEARCRARLLLNEPAVVCGLPAAEAVFRALDSEVHFEALAREGEEAQPTAVAEVEGAARAILTGERIALNLLGRLSGIATLTRRYVDAVAGTGAVILDTRKTTPGLRALEKYAVRCGGGANHRLALDDAVLVKDNHLRLAGGITQAVARAQSTGLPVEVEVETLADVREALAAGPDTILLDNMRPDAIAEAVALVAGTARVEASGGVSLENVRAIAETGVDFISIGSLTHSASSVDVSLEVT
jgi:nicotinate-nucleotide pyrophosphorylase (carboxylating)